MNNTFKSLRKDFPILSQTINNFPLTACDNAATTHKPQAVIDAITHFYSTTNANIYRGVHTFAEKATTMYEDARNKVAHFLGAHPDEIVFTHGTTSGINMIASTWAEKYINTDDEIVITELEHHANLLPWQRLTHKKGAHLRFIPVTSQGLLDLSCLDSLITNKTKLVSVTHVSNAIGTHVDIQTIIAHAQKVGAKVLIDAAQSVPHQKINVHELKCDFLVFSGHKILGPTGIGVLYIKKELHDHIPPYELGGGIVEHVEYDYATYKPIPHRLEAGTPPIAQAIGLGAAIDYLNKNINFPQLVHYEAQLCSALIQGLSHFKEITILGPIEELKQKGHLVSFLVKNYHSHDVASFLSSRGILVRAGHHCAQPFAHKLGYEASIRVSFYFYNTYEDVERIIQALQELLNY